MRICLKDPFRTILCSLALIALVLTTNPTTVDAQSGGVNDELATKQFSPLISNSLFLYASSVLDFDIQSFLDQQQGPLKGYSEEIDGQVWTAAESIAYHAMYYGINPQIILVMLEAQNGLISQSESKIPLRSNSPDDPTHNPVFNLHVKWLAEQATSSYYARYYQQDESNVYFASGEAVNVNPSLNAGSYGLHAALAKIMPIKRWQNWVSGVNPQFRQVFADWFDDPLRVPDTAYVSSAATLPGHFILPFPVGQRWYYTGGPHNYAGSTTTARPWPSIDIAPPETIGCPGGAYPPNRWIVAAEIGTVIMSQQALVVIDHGNGWRTYYSHVATTDRRPEGPVKQGDYLGHPSCEVEPGGKTGGVHVHFAIWQKDAGFVNISGSSLSGWTIQETSHYNGKMTRAGVTRNAEQGRLNGINDIVNSGVGFDSQFTVNAAGWYPRNGIWGTSPNGLYHTSGVADSFASSMNNQINTTLTYTVRMNADGCLNCGNYIYFRGTPNPVTPDGRWNNAYIFEYTNNGYFIIGKQQGGVWYSFMSDWEYSPFISSDWNTLKVTANGNFIQYFINGFRLKTMIVSDFGMGRVGVGFWQSPLNLNHLYIDWATLTPFAPAVPANGANVLDSVVYPEIMPDPKMSP